MRAVRNHSDLYGEMDNEKLSELEATYASGWNLSESAMADLFATVRAALHRDSRLHEFCDELMDTERGTVTHVVGCRLDLLLSESASTTGETE